VTKLVFGNLEVCALTPATEDVHCWGDGLMSEWFRRKRESLVGRPLTDMDLQGTRLCMTSEGEKECVELVPSKEPSTDRRMYPVLDPCRLDGDRLFCKPGAQAPTLTGVTEFAGDTGRGCAVLKDGSTWCWSLDRVAPYESLRGIRALGTTGFHVCGILRERAVCVDDDEGGLTGDGFIPEPPVELERSVDIAACERTFCSLGVSGSLQCWGDIWGELCRGSTGGIVAVPLPFGRFDPSSRLVLGPRSVCLVGRDGTSCMGQCPLPGAPAPIRCLPAPSCAEVVRASPLRRAGFSAPDP
jgi:hypothetical protein